MAEAEVVVGAAPCFGSGVVVEGAFVNRGGVVMLGSCIDGSGDDC